MHVAEYDEHSGHGNSKHSLEQTFGFGSNSPYCEEIVVTATRRTEKEKKKKMLALFVM